MRAPRRATSCSASSSSAAVAATASSSARATADPSSRDSRTRCLAHQEITGLPGGVQCSVCGPSCQAQPGAAGQPSRPVVVALDHLSCRWWRRKQIGYLNAPLGRAAERGGSGGGGWCRGLLGALWAYVLRCASCSRDLTWSRSGWLNAAASQTPCPPLCPDIRHATAPCCSCKCARSEHTVHREQSGPTAGSASTHSVTAPFVVRRSARCCFPPLSGCHFPLRQRPLAAAPCAALCCTAEGRVMRGRRHLEGLRRRPTAQPGWQDWRRVGVKTGSAPQWCRWQVSPWQRIVKTRQAAAVSS